MRVCSAGFVQRNTIAHRLDQDMWKGDTVNILELFLGKVISLLVGLIKSELHLSITLSGPESGDSDTSCNWPLTLSIKALTYTHHHLGRPGPNSLPWQSLVSVRLPKRPPAPSQLEFCLSAAESRWGSAAGGLLRPGGVWANGWQLPAGNSYRSIWSAGCQVEAQWGVEVHLLGSGGGWWERTGW